VGDARLTNPRYTHPMTIFGNLALVVRDVPVAAFVVHFQVADVAKAPAHTESAGAAVRRKPALPY